MQNRQALYDAILNHESDQVIAAIKTGHIALDEPNNAGYTLLQFAAQEGLIDVVLWLLHAGANVNQRSDQIIKTPFQCAKDAGHLLVASLLKSCNGSDQYDENSSANLVYWVITNYHASFGSGLIDKIKLKDTAKIQGLIELAAYINQTDVVRALLNKSKELRRHDVIHPAGYWAAVHDNEKLFQLACPTDNDAAISLHHLKLTKNPNFEKYYKIAGFRPQLILEQEMETVYSDNRLVSLPTATLREAYKDLSRKTERQASDLCNTAEKYFTLAELCFEHNNYIPIFKQSQDKKLLLPTIGLAINKKMHPLVNLLLLASNRKPYDVCLHFPEYHEHMTKDAILSYAIKKSIKNHSEKDSYLISKFFPRDIEILSCIKNIAQDNNIAEKLAKQFYVSFEPLKTNKNSSTLDSAVILNELIHGFIHGSNPEPGRTDDTKLLNRNFYLSAKYPKYDNNILNNKLINSENDLKNLVLKKSDLNLDATLKQLVLLLNMIDEESYIYSRKFRYGVFPIMAGGLIAANTFTFLWAFHISPDDSAQLGGIAATIICSAVLFHLVRFMLQGEGYKKNMSKLVASAPDLTEKLTEMHIAYDTVANPTNPTLDHAKEAVQSRIATQIISADKLTEKIENFPVLTRLIRNHLGLFAAPPAERKSTDVVIEVLDERKNKDALREPLLPQVPSSVRGYGSISNN